MAKINVDMSNVEDGFSLIPEGDYICKVAKVELKRSSEDKPYLKWEFVIGTGNFKGQKLFNNTSLQPQSLWVLRNTLTALGVDVPKKAMTIDTDQYTGKIVGITVAHEEYKKDGKTKTSAKVGELWKAAKGANGWGRAEAQVNKKVEEEPEEDVSTDEDGVENIADGVDEIEI